MLEVTVSEIHRYPLRPEGFEEALFPTAASKRAMDVIRKVFMKRAAKRGVPAKTAGEVFDWMEGFFVYGFPKSHAASFAAISYASACMRCHFPAEFFCGILNSQPMGFYSPKVVLDEARRVGLGVLPPDIRLSEEGFSVEEGGTTLRISLKYCKGLSRAAIASILAERDKRPFSSVSDLYRRTPVERDSLENLIKAGFLDALAGRNANRLRLLEEIKILPKKRSRGLQPEIPLTHPASWWLTREGRRTDYLPFAVEHRERMEWQALSLNVSRHSLSPYRRALKDLGLP